MAPPGPLSRSTRHRKKLQRHNDADIIKSITYIFFYHDATAPLDPGLLIIEESWSHSDTSHSVGLLWTSDQPDTQTSAWLVTTLTRDRHPCPQRDSNPQSQQASKRRNMPYTVWPLGYAIMHLQISNINMYKRTELIIENVYDGQHLIRTYMSIYFPN